MLFRAFKPAGREVSMATLRTFLGTPHLRWKHDDADSAAMFMRPGGTRHIYVLFRVSGFPGFALCESTNDVERTLPESSWEAYYSMVDRATDERIQSERESIERSRATPVGWDKVAERSFLDTLVEQFAVTFGRSPSEVFGMLQQGVGLIVVLGIAGYVLYRNVSK